MLLRRLAALLLAISLHTPPAFAAMDPSAFGSRAAPAAVLWAAEDVSDNLSWPLSFGESDPCFAQPALLTGHYPPVQHLSTSDLRRHPPEFAPDIKIPPEPPAPQG
jgi:hypothetical protein